MSYHILHYRLKKLKRAFLIWITLISLLTILWIDNIRFSIFQTKSNEKSMVQIKRARWFTNQLIKLGSAFIKIGQLLSARPDLIPNTWIQELSKMQDQVPNFSFAQVEETIRDELGSKFIKIDKIICDPVGSASLAQVHRATLKDGKKVVFKVQRPNLKESIIEEATRLAKAENIQENESTNTYQDSKIKNALNEIEGINKQIDLLNKTLNNQI